METALSPATATASLRLINVVLLLLAMLLPPSSSYKEKATNELKLQAVDRLDLPSGFVGPESLAFDRLAGGPYTGVSGGWILKWQGASRGWTFFAANARNKGEECDVSFGHVAAESACGRPLGLQFHEASGVLYVADAYFGLLAVGPEGGAATQVAASAEGVPFCFTNGVDVDQSTGMVYFTDSSTRFQRPYYILVVITGDSTGRLMKYEPMTKKVTVLKNNLFVPNGITLSHDGNFLLVAETGTCKVIKHWLKGPKMGTTEVFAELPGYPDNIKRTSSGEYWVALNREKFELNNASKNKDNFFEHAIAMRFGAEGEVLEVINGGAFAYVSEVVEQNGKLWMGSIDVPYVDVCMS
ncbi:protein STRICTOSIDINE SYNTHASE-LIKE 10-like [Canna indica]|uniref:Protein STRICTOSIDINE SYNTHASE-LIKE 10-like n=1 Tax=Canna indica TaxID=4628 RepID=A0AAQ3KVD2_9LILI|nr:protein STRICTOSIDINE SYNTHASE-LIKE 10-like [Canna indica]